MSWNFCAISGEQVQEPVVSKLTGHVFEKRLIEKHIATTGQCPVTGRALSSDDLISVSLSTQTKPRPVTMNSVPGILKSFTSEWDALMLETYNLKQHLETVRQELSHALYQHDAACRVIARLIKERDEARKEVCTLQEKLAESHRMEEEEVTSQVSANPSSLAQSVATKLPASIISSINETALRLSGTRKERRKDVNYINSFPLPEVIASYGPKHVIEQNNKGVTCLDLHRSLSLTASGSATGCVTISDAKTNAVVATVDTKLPVIDLSFLGNQDDNPKLVVVTEQSAYQYVFTVETKTISQVQVFESDIPLSSVAAHPNGSTFVLAAQNGQFSYHEFNQVAPTLTVEFLVGKVTVKTVQIHPDGNLLGVGCSDGSVKLWNITSNEIITSLEDNMKGAIDLLRFSENGYTLAAGSSESKLVKIFDLRKGACVQTLLGEDSNKNFNLTSLDFDLSGTVLAIANNEGQIRLIETKKWQALSTLSLHTASVTGLRFNTFSLQLVSGSADGNVIVSAQ